LCFLKNSVLNPSQKQRLHIKDISKVPHRWLINSLQPVSALSNRETLTPLRGQAVSSVENSNVWLDPPDQYLQDKP